jgi:streptogramin lyase
MARVDPATGKIDEYKIPYQGHAYPRRMGADANGDLWVAFVRADHGCGPAGAGADLNSPDLAADFISTVNQPSTAALA